MVSPQCTEHPLMNSWYPHMHHNIPPHASLYPPNAYQAFTLFFDCTIMYQSIPSLTIPLATPGDSHILVAPGVGFSLLCLAQGSARGVLNQSKCLIILKKSSIFHLSLKQLSSSSFHMFIYARSEQC